MSFITNILRSLIDFIYLGVHNYGWAIILFTLVVKLILFPLDYKSRKSMYKMSKIQPELNAIQQRYGKDREKLSQKQMELYRRNKISPMSGCLPMLIQWPILFAMFAIMRNIAAEQTVNMLQGMQAGEAPIFDSWLWIKNIWMADSPLKGVLPMLGDLSQYNPVAGTNVTEESLKAIREFVQSDAYIPLLEQYKSVGLKGFTEIPMLFFKITIMQQPNGLFLLAVLSTISQFFMMKIQQPMQAAPPPSDDPTQPNPAMNTKMMTYIFPLISLWICATSNSAFALYWMTSNIFSIIQQVGLNAYFEIQDGRTPKWLEKLGYKNKRPKLDSGEVK